MDAAVVAQEGKGFPSAYAPNQLHRVLTVAGTTNRPPPHRAARQCHAAHATMNTGQH
jgi:hypothetical protein